MAVRVPSLTYLPTYLLTYLLRLTCLHGVEDDFPWLYACHLQHEPRSGRAKATCMCVYLPASCCVHVHEPGSGIAGRTRSGARSAISNQWCAISDQRHVQQGPRGVGAQPTGRLSIAEHRTWFLAHLERV